MKACAKCGKKHKAGACPMDKGGKKAPPMKPKPRMQGY